MTNPAEEPTIRDRRVGRLPRRGDPGLAPLVALGGWLACTVANGLAGNSPAIAWIVVAVLPGLALSPLMPIAARRTPASALVAAIVGSAAFWTIAVPTMSLLGLKVDAAALLGSVGLIAVASLAAAGRFGAAAPRDGRDLADLGGIALVLLAVAYVASHGYSDPPLGSDWGHYWKFVDAIVADGSLDATNPTWFGGGLPFGDYPGLPSLLAAWVALAGVTAAATPGLIIVLYAAGALAAWLAVKAWWDSGAAAMTGVAAAIMPPAITSIGWSGLALALSLVFALPMLACTAALLRTDGAEGRRIRFAVAALAVAIISSQPLTAMIVLGGLGVMLAIQLVLGRLRGLRALLETGVIALVLAVPVVIDYRDRLGKLGVAQDHRVFLRTRIDWQTTMTTGLLPALAVGLGLLGLIAAAATSSRTRGLAIAAGITVLAAIGYSQAWILEIAGEYRRAVYLIGPALAVGFGGLTLIGRSERPWLRFTAAALVLGSFAFAVSSWPQRMHDFYETATPVNAGVVKGVGVQAERTRTTILTDACWSFPALGLTNATLWAALDPQMVGPKSEVAPAREARNMFRGRNLSRGLIRLRNVRWTFVDPSCASESGLPPGRFTPPGFRKIYSSPNLVVGYRPFTLPVR